MPRGTGEGLARAWAVIEQEAARRGMTAGELLARLSAAAGRVPLADPGLAVWIATVLPPDGRAPAVPAARSSTAGAEMTTGQVQVTLKFVDALAARAHAGQVDTIGVPYIEHVRAVAAGLASFGTHLQMAGLLHDVIEDTDWTSDRLRATGIPDQVVRIVEDVTHQPGVPYEEKIRRITGSRDATLVKIADNAHNSRPDRAAQLPEDKRARLAAKYRKARDVLWPAAGMADVETIVSVVNPALLAEIAERQASGASIATKTKGDAR